ncbi:MAG: FHA domain-containing protein, partial [Anaerolineales bacterium]
MYASKKYVLRYRKDDETWKEMPLAGEISIGRSAQATLQLEDEEISPVHVRLELKSDGAWVTDLGSVSGTILEGQRLEPQMPVRLKERQSFQTGSYNFTLFEIQPQSVDERQTGEAGTTSVEKLVSRSPWLRWVLEHATLVSGVVITIALVSVALVFFLIQQQNAQVAA